MRRSPLALTMAALGALAAVFLLLPLLGLVLRIPWQRIATLAADPSLGVALRLSLLASAVSLVLSTLLGVPLAWVLARHEFPGKRALRALTTLPIVLPPVVGGVALLVAFGRRGIVGAPLAAATGVTFPFTLAGVVLAATFVSMPLLVITAEAAFRSIDRRMEDAAATLGAAPGYAFRRVVLPLAARPIAAGMALCWTRALGEFGATITFAGNLPGHTQTMPLAVYLALESNPEVAYLGSLVLLAVSIAVLVTLRGRGIAAT
jgi:molybdate transport system permease protein